MENETLKRHEAFIRHCLRLASRAKENGYPPVGSIIVKEHKIFSEGFEGERGWPAPVAHSEMVAIMKAIEHLGKTNLSNCILYTTVEPCFMCSYMIRKTKMKGVVFGMRTDGAGGYSSNYPILSAKDIEKWGNPPFVVEGILEEECRGLFTRASS